MMSLCLKQLHAFLIFHFTKYFPSLLALFLVECQIRHKKYMPPTKHILSNDNRIILRPFLTNMAEISLRVADIRSGKSILKEHELIEVDE